MKYNYKLNADNRVKVTVYPADETLPVLDFPAEFDPAKQSDWQVLDGEAIYNPEPEPAEPELEPGPSEEDKLAAQVTYTAMMTDTLLDSEV